MCCEAISALGVGCSGEGGGVVGREGVWWGGRGPGFTKRGMMPGLARWKMRER